MPDRTEGGLLPSATLVGSGGAGRGPTAAGLLTGGRIRAAMDSVRKGLRSEQITKDTYERLLCAECGETLATRDNPDGLGKLRSCPECGREWQQVG